jgi:mono/diheme cytochrome c family protein
MLKPVILSVLAILAGSGKIALLTAAAPAQQTKTAPPSPIQPRQVLDTYCVTCHNARLKTAGLVLDTLDPAHVETNAATWEKVVARLRAQTMPPPPARRPDKATYDALASTLEGALDRAALENPNPGRPAVHRLNRAEYANAVRDLLGVVVDARELLPVDDSGYGFDNIADVLSVSPGLLERYMNAARRISRLAVGDPDMKPALQTYSAPKYLVQDDRMDEQLPFGSRGGIAIPHYFPLDGEYTLKVRLYRTWRDEIRGLSRSHTLDIRLDRTRIKSLTFGGDGERAIWLPGQAVPNPTAYELNADAPLEVRFAAKAGQHTIGLAFQQQTVEEEGYLRPSVPVTSFEYAGNREGNPAVDSVVVGGPYNPAGAGDTASRRRIFVCRPGPRLGETACARQIVRTLARRAFRRPVTPADVDVLMQAYTTGRRNGLFDAGIEFALRRILVSPEFIFRIEHDPQGVAPGTPYRISDVELASRLSFFLWSSIPDDELLTVAEQGQLKTPAGLQKQIRRMLADPRSASLVSNFVGQWLYLRNLRTDAPDPTAFPDFEDNLRQAFQKETELFFQANLAEDRSVLDLLRADFTFVNERLARHYGIPGIYGSHFRRVVLQDKSRAGLLGQGSVLTVTSYPTRTSPVLRGKWLLENVLGAPPPAPPPNVPALKDTGESGKPATVRERMEQHRKNPACAACHARMDPLGFALENFDAIGAWRDSDANAKIDASGVMPDGTKFDGPDGLRAVLLSRGDQFVRTMVEKLLTYALGRGLEPADMPVVRQITRSAAARDYRWSDVISGIASSVPFEMRATPAADEARAETPKRALQP